MDERRDYRVWIDPDGAVWIEDPDRGALPLAEALQPGFTFARSSDALGPARLAATRRLAAPGPWPEAITDLFALHDRLLAAPPSEAGPGEPNLLDLKREIARRLAKACVLCEHRCGVERPAGERGVCRVGPTSYVGAAYVHLAEEREIAPSFCVALTGCSWHCTYCHTYDLINRVDAGTPLTGATLAPALAADVRSVSFVGGNPDHHLVAVLDALAEAPEGFDRPIVWNSNMYGSPELYRVLDGVVDVYLGDLRYGDDACAQRLSGLSRCVEPVARNWQLAAEQGALLIARLLLLPGHVECCLKPNVAWLAAHLPDARVSLLDQFHPAYLVAKRTPELNRAPSPDEVAAARAAIEAAGLRVVAPIEG